METDLSVHATARPASRYLAAGAPIRCQNPSCSKPFEGSCQRGEDDHYYCGEACARAGRGTDRGVFENVVRLGKASG